MLQTFTFGQAILWGWFDSSNPELLFCVHPYESTTREGTALARAGVVLETNVTLYEAMSTCESTVVNGHTMRLIWYDEWLLAGDVDPDKGELFPWKEKDDSRCVITTPDTNLLGQRFNQRVHCQTVKVVGVFTIN